MGGFGIHEIHLNVLRLQNYQKKIEEEIEEKLKKNEEELISKKKKI